MRNKRIYIRVNGTDDCHKAFDILTKLGGRQGRFISARCSGWMYIDVNGEIRFLMDTESSYPAKHAEGINYQCYKLEGFPESVIVDYKCRLLRELITKPIVTQKEYRNTIEILEEVKNNIKGGENWYIHMCYEEVIKHLKSFLNA